MRIASLQPSITITLAALKKLDALCACTKYCLEALPELAQQNPQILHDSWTANTGTYIFEPPGELHTLIVPATSKEPMITLFVLSGGLIYVNSDGSFLGYDDGFTLLELARRHYKDAGLDQAELDAMIR